MGKLLAEAQGEAITEQLQTSTLNLGYSGSDHCHSQIHGHSRGHSHSCSHSHGYSRRVIGSYWIWSLVKTSSNHTQSKGQKPSTRVAFYKRHLYYGQVTTKTSTMITMLTNTTMMLMRLTMVLVAGGVGVDNDDHIDQYHDLYLY